MLVIEELQVRAGSFTLHASVHLREGEYFAILGHTGSGKTLFLETLAGLRKPVSGRILFDEVEVTHLPPQRRQVGYVPQDCALFPISL